MGGQCAWTCVTVIRCATVLGKKDNQSVVNTRTDGNDQQTGTVNVLAGAG